ncbi:MULTISPECIES: protein YhfH [Aneurinibacillus]|uniref:YhfH family protein n=1 Tax=Aneurinibacillus thermoaerophilus TaxID=143495 RepID=A0A1G8BYQ9_ANETH|nr:MULTISPECIES: protein YhfH [Aneurinibacillus]MED0675107.1 protein YhfH [Aneurinibacillus thermoaerophilus]MED0679256.1 protein YhfH [Aneurinibacillus thermoaerophilus]MED0737142.1 protein YhfH [Aneurinibacillus thermoaerophilus]MED0757188.1 protein YhfH [Aneurinibacillus thermoaerophilus]MED0762488.1 protein YhfH [Aneurinibacillus thermoaerophilus]
MTRDLEFYKNLPQKQCRECGEVIEEQAESYIYECERCFSHKHE